MQKTKQSILSLAERKQVILDLADRAAGGYDKEIDGSPDDYIEWVLDWYTGASCPEPIKKDCYQDVIKYHSWLLRQEIRVAIKRVEVLIKEFEE